MSATITAEVATSCACGSAESRVLREARDRRFGTPGTFQLVRCIPCGLVRTDPTPASLQDAYPAAYYAHSAPREPSERVKGRFHGLYHGSGSRASRWLDQGAPPRLQDATRGTGRLLDVGCGSGEFLLAMASAGWTADGVEPDPEAAAAARNAGLLVLTGELGSVSVDGDYDVIRFWHSLEHIPDPARALKAAWDALAPGGLLVIGVPNYSSLLSLTCRNRWFYLDVPRHLWHFERYTLRGLVESNGYRIKRVRNTSTSTPLLGTLDFLLGRGERLVNSRAAWYAALPLTAAVDALRLGDGLEVLAVKA